MLLDEWALYNFNDPRPGLLILDEELVDQLAESIAVNVWNWLLLVLNDFENQAQKILGMERVFECAQLIKDAAQGPNVRLVSVWFVLTHLGRHIVWRTLHGHCTIMGSLKHFGDTKITHFDRIILC